MAIMTRRKTAAAALVVVGIAGLSIASAAQLNLTSSSLGAGETVVASCQPEGDINVSFENEFNGGKYEATGVKLTNVAAACDGLDFKITVAGDPSVETKGKIAGTSQTITLASAVPASAVVNVALVIFD